MIGLVLLAAAYLVSLAFPLPGLAAEAAPQIGVLPDIHAPAEKQVELGRLLFFDPRLSGDASTSCATCHDPRKAYTDGMALSNGYPSTLYFRNTKALYNVASAEVVYWDGRLTAKDLPTVVRDHLTEAHFMQVDGRLLPERLKQIPRYEKLFQEAFNGEPTFGRILESVSAFVKTIRTTDAPAGRFLKGDRGALSSDAKNGLELFTGKAGCVRCHSGPLLSDQKPHALGVAENTEIFTEIGRHITFRRFFKTFGVGGYAVLRTDPGYQVVTQQSEDAGKFVTPSLWEVSRTSPYMHNGMLKTLDEVVAFYNGGGGPNKDLLMKRLGLSKTEQRALVSFLVALSSKETSLETPKLAEYALRTLGKN